MARITWRKVADVETQHFHLDGRIKSSIKLAEKGLFNTGSNFQLYDAQKRVISAIVATTNGTVILKKSELRKLGGDLPLQGSTLVIKEKSNIYFAKISKVI